VLFPPEQEEEESGGGSSRRINHHSSGSSSASTFGRGSALQTMVPPANFLVNPIFLTIQPSYLVPPPVIRIRIPFTQTAMSIFQKSYTQYHMFLKQGRLSWRVLKR
jgi:hypothetical protein